MTLWDPGKLWSCGPYSTLAYVLQITHAVGTDAPRSHHRGWFLHFSLVTWSMSSLARRIRHPFFPKTSWNVDLSDQRTCSHCLSVHHRWLRVQRKDFPKYSWTHVAMSITVAWSFVKRYRLRARWSHAFSSGFRFWLLRTKIFPDSLNIFMILWTVDGERPKFFTSLHWETLSLNWLAIISQSLPQSGEPRLILACKD